MGLAFVLLMIVLFHQCVQSLRWLGHVLGKREGSMLRSADGSRSSPVFDALSAAERPGILTYPERN
jgi:hypothetical protein